MSWPPPLLIQHPRRPWSLDATRMHITEADLDGLPWDRVFAEMRDLEAGGIANPDEHRQVGHYWLRAPERAPTVGQARAIGETDEAIRDFAARVLDGRLRAPNGERFTDFVHIGIGGSALGPMLVADALGTGTGLHPWFVDNTDPDGVHRTLERLGDALATALVVVVSKSGGTVETHNGMLLVQDACTRRGLPVPGRMVAVTGEGSKLDALAERDGWLRRFPLWDWVGGRTSVTSAVGLLPAALLGVDTQAFLHGARDMDDWTRAEAWRENPAALLAGTWHVVGHGRGDRVMVILPYADRLILFARYLQQLVMESLGKRLDRQGHVVEQGIDVYGNKGSTDQHAYVQQLRDGRNDFFVTFVQVLSDGAGSQLPVADRITAGDYLQGFLLGTRRALFDKDRPSLVVTLPRVEPYELGALIALFERTVGFYGSLVDINAYHQPGVEAGKKAAETIVALSRALRDALKAEPGDVLALANRLQADPTEVWYVLEHLAANGRVVREGDAPDASWRLPRGAEVEHPS